MGTDFQVVIMKNSGDKQPGWVHRKASAQHDTDYTSKQLNGGFYNICMLPY